jgi:hypothetical protein
VEIVSSLTKVDIRWQDGTLVEGVAATSLVPVLPDGNEFHPGDFVVEKGEEDLSADSRAIPTVSRTGELISA